MKRPTTSERNRAYSFSPTDAKPPLALVCKAPATFKAPDATMRELQLSPPTSTSLQHSAP